MQELTRQQQTRVEENMGLVGQVIRDCVHTLPSASIYTYEDLHQIGCIGLCKAVLTDRPGHTAAFSTYARRLILNEIYSALEYATRRGREVATDPVELPAVTLPEGGMEQTISCKALLALLDQAEAETSGVMRKGVRAIRLLAQGYTSREIGEQFGVPANYVTAWVARARKHLSAMSGTVV